jgi:hypothetical protein
MSSEESGRTRWCGASPFTRRPVRSDRPWLAGLACLRLGNAGFLGARLAIARDDQLHGRCRPRPVVRAVLDRELVAFDDTGRPDFPLVCKAVLHRRDSIPLVFVAFDVLSVEGRSVVREPVLEAPKDPRGDAPRRTALARTGRVRRRPGVIGRGVRARTRRNRRQRRSGRYLPGERGWVKVKNRGYWRYELERESAMRQRVGRRPAT